MFKGYLLKFKSSHGEDIFPMELMEEKTYDPAPNRMQDLDSKVLQTGILKRNVLKHTRSTISFKTLEMTGDTLNQKIMSVLRKHYINQDERDLMIEYYSPDYADYRTGHFYLDANMKYPIDRIDKEKNIVYHSSITFSFVEY